MLQIVRLTVMTQMDGNWVHVSIQDTGRGIPPEVQAKLFGCGFTTKPVGVGTGLGLPIAKQIVEEKHGGRISFETAVGEGTTFHVHIPVRSQEPA